MSEAKSLTELAAIKTRRAYEERRKGARYGQAVADSFAAPFERDAAAMLKLEHPPVVGIGGEVTAPQVRGLRHNQVVAIETLGAGATRVAEDASIRRTDLLLQPSVDVIALAADAADSIQASNSLEKMLAHQLAIAHEMAMTFAGRALHYQAGNAGAQVEACRLANATARLMGTFQDGLLTLQKLRCGGNQTVTVQHVNVEAGAQAVIGNVQTGGPKPGGSENSG